MFNQSILAVIASVSFGTALSSLFADERSAAEFLPDSVAVYAELPGADLIYNHPLRERVFGSAVAKEILRSPDILKMRGGIAIAELALGDTLENTAGRLSARGLTLAVDAETGGAILLARGATETTSSEFVKKIVALARNQEADDKSIALMRELEYRGYRVYERDKIAFAAVDDWLFVTNKGPLGKTVIDRYLDRKKRNSLSQNTLFEQARLKRESQRNSGTTQTEILWSWFNLPVLRERGLTTKLAKDFSKNPAAELILGGLLEPLKSSPYIVATLHLTDQSVQLKATVPLNAEWLSPSREFYFGPGANGQAEPLVELDDSLVSISAYRDVSAMWVAGDLFSEEVNEKMAQADSTLTTLFSGREFGEEILGAINPELRIVVKRQTFAAEAPKPAIVLPSFALIARLREPELMQRELKRIFQSLVGFLNVAGANNGQPQLDLDSEKTKTGSLVMATYVPEADRQGNSEAAIQYNFSPCLAFEGNYAVLSSSVQLARESVARLGDGQTLAAASNSNARKHNAEISVRAHAVREVLEANHRQLVSQNMLEKGHSKERAEAEVKTLLQLLDLLDSARLTLDVDNELTLSGELKVSYQP